VTEKIIARQIGGGLWQWRHVANHGGWASEYYSTGDAEAVADTRPSSTVPVCLAMGGQSVAVRDVDVEGIDKRHMAKLLPYEMEDFLVDNVEDLHFVIAPPEEGQANVLYAKSEAVGKAISPLQDLKCDIPLCLPEYLYLRRENNGVTIVFEDNLIVAHIDEGKGFSVEANIAPVVVAGIGRSLEPHQTVNIIADTNEKLEALASWLPEAWRLEGGPDVKAVEGGFWDWAEPSMISSNFNMRRGPFAKQLPFDRWIKHWKVPASIVAAAFLVSVVSNYMGYFSAKSENKRIIQEIQTVYQKAVPGGKARDPEGDLRAKVKTLGKKTEHSNFMLLFNSVASSLKGGADMKIGNIRYNSDQRELQLNVEGKDFGALEAMRGKVTAMGFAAEFIRVDQQAGAHNARMKVSEAK